MRELVLKYSDPDLGEREEYMKGDSLVIGRHSECEIVIRDTRLSREHVKLERSSGVFTVTDLGSSNGTTLNGLVVEDAVEVRDGDILKLGGAVTITVGLIGQEYEDKKQTDDEAPPPAKVRTAPAAGEKGIGIELILAAVLGLVILIGVGVGGVLLFGDRGGKTTGVRTDDADVLNGSGSDSGQNKDKTIPEASPDLIASPVPADDAGPANTESPDIENSTDSSDPANTDGAENSDRKTEALVYAFMKRIAKNDQRPYLTQPRLKEVVGRISRYRGSTALASNIKSAVSNSGRIAAVAKAKNLQPQFLAAAALTRLGNSRGDVAATASEMSGVLDRLTIVLSNELADDALLVIAAYSEGVEGNSLKMRDRLAGLAKKNPTASSREIRSIWFLKERNEISNAQYEFALNFLAIGTITQNPKEFGVNSEALRLD